MEFPHTITIFGKVNNSKYPRDEIQGVMWYGSDGFTIDGKGIKPSGVINIIIPKSKISNKFPIVKGCRIVKGQASDIEQTINELDKYDNVITITNVTSYDVGSDLDGLLITGE